VRLGGGNPKLDLLKRVPLFANSSKHDLEAIGRIADELDLPEGRELITQGRRGQQFFVLVEGSAEVRRGGEVVNTLQEGDFFGELSLLSDRETTATVTATSPVRVLVITPQSFRRLMRESESVQQQVLEALAERMPRDQD
jgi:cAMP-dependent protein kinase regulator